MALPALIVTKPQQMVSRVTRGTQIPNCVQICQEMCEMLVEKHLIRGSRIGHFDESLNKCLNGSVET